MAESVGGSTETGDAPSHRFVSHRRIVLRLVRRIVELVWDLLENRFETFRQSCLRLSAESFKSVRDSYVVAPKIVFFVRCLKTYYLVCITTAHIAMSLLLVDISEVMNSERLDSVKLGQLRGLYYLGKISRDDYTKNRRKIQNARIYVHTITWIVRRFYTTTRMDTTFAMYVLNLFWKLISRNTFGRRLIVSDPDP